MCCMFCCDGKEGAAGLGPNKGRQTGWDRCFHYFVHSVSISEGGQDVSHKNRCNKRCKMVIEVTRITLHGTKLNVNRSDKPKLNKHPRNRKSNSSSDV